MSELPRNATEDELLQYLHHDVEGLLDAIREKQLIKAAFILRKWVSEKANYPERPLLLLHWEYSLSELLWLLLHYEGGIWCGGCAYLFASLLNLIGIPAAVFMYGSETLSHETTVFGIKSGKEMEFYILDAYLNFHYQDAQTGKLIPLSTLLRLVKEKKHVQIERIDEPIARHLVTRDREASFYKWMFPEGLPEAIPSDSRFHVYPGAYHSVSGLLIGGPFRELIDQAKGKEPVEHFLLDMMLVRPLCSAMTVVREAYPQLALYRGIIAGLADEPEWAKTQDQADYSAWSRKG